MLPALSQLTRVGRPQHWAKLLMISAYMARSEHGHGATKSPESFRRSLYPGLPRPYIPILALGYSTTPRLMRVTWPKYTLAW